MINFSSVEQNLVENPRMEKMSVKSGSIEIIDEKTTATVFLFTYTCSRSDQWCFVSLVIMRFSQELWTRAALNFDSRMICEQKKENSQHL